MSSSQLMSSPGRGRHQVDVLDQELSSWYGKRLPDEVLGVDALIFSGSRDASTSRRSPAGARLGLAR